ncbi:hypothetical protein MLD38_029388 [Melastoma candidum]|uniref:Uncharacterized protein n=1 Tax=Melastoma candidum TaxID=119954 RepID=A0ACB9N3Z3_9MYRT|nr:hypothetical protein MLD38_029388 [Melastoma candidum]
MDSLMRLVCPDSPSVWDGGELSPCFRDLVLGFGANLVTLFTMAVLGVAKRKRRRNYQMNIVEKGVLCCLPILGASLSLLDMALLVRSQHFMGADTYHSLIFRGSRFLLWTTIFAVSMLPGGPFVFKNRFLCIWFIVKPFLEIPLLQESFHSRKVTVCIKESCLLLMDIVFAILLNIIRTRFPPSKGSSKEDPLLEVLDDGGDDYVRDSDYFWNTLLFKSIAVVMERGIGKQLGFEDLPLLPEDMDPSFCHTTLKNCWKAQWEAHGPESSLFKALFHAYGWSYLRLGLVKVTNDCLGFAGPLLLNKLIRFLQNGSQHLDGYLLAITLGIASILKSFLDTQYTYYLAKLKLKLRSSIMISIYKKCLAVSLAERSQFSAGEIQTFMSIDAERTVNMCNSFHDAWSLPVQIGVALYLLYTQVKFAFLSGFALTVLLIPVNKWISTLIAAATEKMMKQKDERIRKTGELLAHIRTIKMYSWEPLFSSWLLETRTAELKHLSTRKYLDAWCVFFWATTPTLFSILTFGLYTLMGHQLDAATVFTCIALFNTLISPLNSFPWVINGLIDAFISSRRLSRFLCCSEHRNSLFNSSSLTDTEFISENISISMQDACCVWSSSSSDNCKLVIDHVSLVLPMGSLVAVIGEVGSGKSSLVNAFLGEMRLTHGRISSFGRVAYVPQVPWILSGTLRDNILFGNNYSPERYNHILRACTLDIDISMMTGGDTTYVGEKGITLSGGQRARLALARALYHVSDVLVLDDVLSAVDARVALWILDNAIRGSLIEKKTCILCTHNAQAISVADVVVVMEKGHAVWVGSPTDLVTSRYTALCPTVLQNVSLLQDQLVSLEAEEVVCQDSNFQSSTGEAQDIIEEEERKEGSVELYVYKSYAKFSGWLVSIIIFLSAILMQASRNGNDLWLSYWVDTSKLVKQLVSSQSFYLTVLCCFCVANSILTLIRAFSFAYGGLRAAVKVHATLLHKLISSPAQFFDQTPTGRIVNRFSSDIYTIDDSLPFILNILLAHFVGLLGIVIVLSYVQVFILSLLLPLGYIYSKLQFFYRSSSRELRRLDSVARSPIYTSFTETLDGASTIRAFKFEEIFFTRFIKHLKLYQRTSYSELTASLWLSLRLQLLAAMIISFVAVMSVIGSRNDLPIGMGSPGMVGLALSYAAPVVSLLGNFLSSFTETEKEMVSLERIVQYIEIPEEKLDGPLLLNLTWPSRGQIFFQNVMLRYLPLSPPALDDVTFTISGGTQVGIVGRTGAGKSSIVSALFRLNNICGGHILVDGIDINEVPVRDLRSRFAVVPQSAFLFEGSLRDNLDPYRVNDDAKIWSTLDKCHMKEDVEIAGGLDILVKEAGASFSVGQRQLLCLARAFLKSSKVLCLDECTASIDAQTASILQDTISKECRGITVVTIAHRISTILGMDKVLVLDHGHLVEEGNPRDLLENKHSRFAGFACASTM